MKIVRNLNAIWQELNHEISTENTFCKIFKNSKNAFWLDSNSSKKGMSRWSYLGEAQNQKEHIIEYKFANPKKPSEYRIPGDRNFFLKNLQDSLNCKISNPPPVPFKGGYLGWFGYEMLQETRYAKKQYSNTPDALFIHVNRYIAVDHEQKKTFVIALIESGKDEKNSNQWIKETISILKKLKSKLPVLKIPNKEISSQLFQFQQNKYEYLANIEQCLKWINQGEVYQICLTNEISCNVPHDAFKIYKIMRRINPAPYGAYIKWYGGAIVSASPERYLKINKNGIVETKPIKGTIQRHKNPDIDKMLRKKLYFSEKDRAENVMIVDLLRNDLSKVCLAGSVKVPKLFDVETYATVHQLVSTVTGKLSPNKSVIDLIEAAFPGGSMTGAPKMRAMELIGKLEKRPRGIYSGCIGWLGFDGESDLSIVIRTIVSIDNKLTFGVGGGIVAQSTPEQEYQEMLLKAKASMIAISTAIKYSDKIYI